MSEQDLILTRWEDGIGFLTFNRPNKMNAFNNQLMQDAMAAMDDFAQADDVHAVVVSGAGRTFSAGFDLMASGERKLDSIDKVRAQMALQFDFIIKFWDCPKPTIAAVHGYCLAGAFEASLACDITIAADDAIFGEPEVRFGTGAVAMLLPWITGPKQAKELMLTGEDRLSAQDALRMGLVNRLVPGEELQAQARAMAVKIARSASVSVRLSKQAINRSYEIMGMRQALLSGLDIDVEINATPSWEKQEFARIRKEQGVNAAIAWRDGRFADGA
ncbi:MAG: enoyl-CoA hydratase/isomerase family protein [Alphaproteobacteria bacterium]|nr:enoyl-CoA hydratase/isomerase family protein [Alphaproteobacteria bacterium]